MTSGEEIRKINPEDFWRLAQNEEKIKFLLRYGILAPSTHNSQPWLFKISSDSCKIYYDKSKEIIQADPVSRDLFISFGCLTENIALAAAYFKIDSKINFFPANDPECIIEISFPNLGQLDGGVDKSLERLIEIMTERVNARGIFDEKNISAEIIKKLSELSEESGIKINFIADKNEIVRIADLTAKGLRHAYSSSIFRKEMARWVNSSFSSLKEGIPGYSLRLPKLMSIIFPWLVKNFDIGKTVGVLNYKSVSSAPGVIVISSENSKLNWLKVGRLAERLMLHSRIFNLKTSVFVASIEMSDFHKEIQAITKSELLPQFLFCIGYLDYEQKPNLRHSVEEKIIK